MRLPVSLQARNIVHRYGVGDTELTALYGVDLDIRPGEVTLLMGPSGSGKTTLIQVLGGLLRPSGGTVSYLGRDIARLGEEERNRLRRENFGFVFQANNLFPTLTSTENVMVALDLLGYSFADSRRRAHEILTLVGLEQKLNVFPEKLSGGQRQRVGIARALASNPRILFADEPTAALDAASGHRVMELMRELAQQSERSVVIVTHDGRILDMADRIIFLEDGRIMKTEERDRTG